MKRKQPMPSYYSKNIVQNAQRRFLKRKAQEGKAVQGKPAEVERQGDSKQKATGGAELCGERA